jgi:hypothetical protein
MREVTQKKFDKAQKLINKGYTPTAACKEVKLNYIRYKELLEIDGLPKSEEYKEKENNILKAIDNEEIKTPCIQLDSPFYEEIKMREDCIADLQAENDKLKKFIKEIL